MAVYPEGFKGLGKLYADRYKLQRFGRGGFVSAAVRAQVPIIPVSIVGSEEIYPLLGRLPTLARAFGWSVRSIGDTDEVQDALAETLAEDGPALLHVRIAPEANCLPMFRPGGPAREMIG